MENLQKIMQNFKNIIFDFGGVLIDIDFRLTIDAFHQIGFPAFEHMYSQYEADQLFRKLEKGEVSDQDFYEVMLKVGKEGLSQEDIRKAWNALLLDYRRDSLHHLLLLEKRYQLFLLSNTNKIHYDRFIQYFPGNAEKPTLESYFSKAYFSFEMGMRKPDLEIYKFVLSDAGIIPEETLFIDDSYPNIDAAKELGFQTHLLKPDERIEKILQ